MDKEGNVPCKRYCVRSHCVYELGIHDGRDGRLDQANTSCGFRSDKWILWSVVHGFDFHKGNCELWKGLTRLRRCIVPDHYASDCQRKRTVNSRYNYPCTSLVLH